MSRARKHLWTEDDIIYPDPLSFMYAQNHAFASRQKRPKTRLHKLEHQKNH